MDTAEYPFDFFYLRISGNTCNTKLLEKRINPTSTFILYDLQINRFGSSLHLRSLF
jgi:hypothetical protein